MIAMQLSDLAPDNTMYAYTHCEIHPSMILGEQMQPRLTMSNRVITYLVASN